MSISYRILYVLSVIVTVVLVGLGFAIGLGPNSALGLDEHGVALCGLVSAMLGALSGFLPRMNKPPSDERRGMD